MAHTNHLSASAHHLSSYVLMTIDLCFWRKKNNQFFQWLIFFPCIRASFIIIIIIWHYYLQIVFYRAIRVLQCYSAHIWWNICTYFGHWIVCKNNYGFDNVLTLQVKILGKNVFCIGRFRNFGELIIFFLPH